MTATDTTADTDTAEPERAGTPHTWIYLGVRQGSTRDLVDAWQAHHGLEMYYKPQAGRLVIGGAYTVRITEDDTHTVKHGDAQYQGYRADAATSERVAQWEAEDHLARIQAATERLERRHATESALDEALAPVLDIARKLRTRADRDAYAAMVLRRINGAWASRR